MVATQKVSYKYPEQSVLSFPDITVPLGQHTLIIGDSGCGKTTLLHLLSGLRKPTSGSVCIDEQDISKMSDAGLDKFRGENIGMIFQTPHFVRSLTVEENLLLAQKLSGASANAKVVKEILDQLQIGEKRSKKTQALSIGEQQRVAIARSLVNNPKVIFADEPTSALDDQNTDRVIELLRGQAEKSGATLIVVTHDKRLKDDFSNRIEL